MSYVGAAGGEFDERTRSIMLMVLIKKAYELSGNKSPMQVMSVATETPMNRASRQRIRILDR
jgi:hypothetical protein